MTDKIDLTEAEINMRMQHVERFINEKVKEKIEVNKWSFLIPIVIIFGFIGISLYLVWIFFG